MSAEVSEEGDAPPNGEGELPFERILERLHHVVARLEGGDLPLEESISVFEEGIRLSRLGAQRLDEVEQRVELLLAEDRNGSPRTRRLDEAEGDDP